MSVYEFLTRACYPGSAARELTMKEWEKGYMAGEDAAIANPRAFRIAPAGTPDWQRGWREGFRETSSAMLAA